MSDLFINAWQYWFRLVPLLVAASLLYGLWVAVKYIFGKDEPRQEDSDE